MCERKIKNIDFFDRSQKILFFKGNETLYDVISKKKKISLKT